MIIGLPVVVAAIAVPAAAQAAPTPDVASSMAAFAEQQAGANAEAHAAEKRARYLARKQAGKAAGCDDCADCAPCEACKECDVPDERSEREGGLP
jgi:hypothetical protein